MSDHHNVAKQRDPMEVVVVEIVMDGNKMEEEEEKDIPGAHSAKALRRSSGGSLHMRSFCVCGEDRLARRLSRSSVKLQMESADGEGEKRK